MQRLDLFAAFLLGVLSAVCIQQSLSTFKACQHGRALNFVLVLCPRRASVYGCSTYGPVLLFPGACLRLILYYSLQYPILFTCPPPCVGAMWLLSAWVMRDVRPV